MRFLKYVFITLAVSLTGIAVLYAVFYARIAPLPVRTFEQVKASYKKSDACLLDRHGRVIQEMRVDFSGRRLDWAELNDISPALVNSVVAAEDKRFYSHHGVDWIALFSAAFNDASGHHGRIRGASTITMQLASMLNGSLQPHGGARNLIQKIAQIKTALQMERHWSKQQILEAYLNLVTFRGELQGITAASKGLFGKGPSGLNWPESLVLASLIRAPNAPATKVIARAFVLSTEQPCVKSTKDEIVTASYKALSNPDKFKDDSTDGLAFNAALMLLSKDHPKVVSSLDRSLQKFATQTLQQYVGELKSQNVSDGAVLVLDNKTGQVLAYVANMGIHSPNPFVDGIQAKRQAGSTLKPFLYALAFEKRILTPASLLNDEPLDVPTSRGIYSPNDYDKKFKGLVTVREALASSINVPAVRAEMLVGADSFVNTLKKFGFRDLRGGEYYGPSLALGTADVSLWELTNAYRTLANGGRWSQAIMLPDHGRQRIIRAASPDAVFLISSILSDRQARSTTFGLENPLSTGFWSAVKTGTSKDMRDNWCIGYSTDFTVGVWVGNFGGQPMWNVSGISGAAPVWLAVMNYLHKGRKNTVPGPPEGVVRRSVVEAGNAVAEWFISGTEPRPQTEKIVNAKAQDDAAVVEPKIIYPAKDELMALDPDIPPSDQKVFFEANAEGRWVLDGNPIGKGNMLPWTPVKGRHQISLLEGTHVSDKVSFVVR